MREIKAIHAIEQITSNQLTGREMVCFLVPDSLRPKFLVKIDTNLYGFVAPDSPSSGPTFVESSYEKAIQKALEGKRQLFTFDDMDEAMKYLPDMIREASGKKPRLYTESGRVVRADVTGTEAAIRGAAYHASVEYNLAGSGEPLPDQANMKRIAAWIEGAAMTTAELDRRIAKLEEKKNAPVVSDKKADTPTHKPTDNTEYIPYDLFVRILDLALIAAVSNDPKAGDEIREIRKRNNFFGPPDRYIHVVLTP